MIDEAYLDGFYRTFNTTLEGSGVAALSRLQRDAMCVKNFQTEVNNGGIYQYLLNSSGDFANETVDVFRRIGANEAARLLEQANACFGPDGPPTDQETRVATMRGFPKSINHQIEDATREFYNVQDGGMCLDDVFDAYLLAHRHQAPG